MSCANYIGAFTPAATNATPIETICRGSDPNYQGTNWTNFWISNNGTICQTEFNNILYGKFNNTNPFRTFDSTQLQRIRNDLNNAFRTYNQIYTITSPGLTGYNSFQETLLQTCQNIPGACDDFLNNYCTGCNRDFISKSGLLTRMCGCRAPGLPPEYNITVPACDPLCNKANAIHTINTSTGTTNICNADVCVIDDIAISSVKSQIGGNIIFSQVCESCKQQCNCIISSIDITTALSDVGLTNKTQFDSSCSTGTCFASGPGGTLTPVVCPTSNVPKIGGVPVLVDSGIVVVLLIIVLIVVIGIVAYYTRE